MPKVSIVLPTYNGEKYIRQSIDSIINQTFTDWELIIVDDCSTDNTLDIVNEYAKKDNRIRIIHNKINQKLPNSLNIGFAVSNGEYLTWTSDDNMYKPTAIDEMCEYLNKHEKYMVCAAMDYIDQNNNLLCMECEIYSDEKIYCYNCVGACFMYKREILDAVGEYDIDLFGVEDYDYWLQIVNRYKSIGYIEKKLYKYRVHDGSLTATKKEKILKQLAKMRNKHKDIIINKLQNKKSYISLIYRDYIRAGYTYADFSDDYKSLMKIFQYDMMIEPNNSIIVFGAGDFGNRIYDLIGDEIICYVDNSKNKIGKTLNGIEIVSLDKIKEKIDDNINIIVAVSYSNLYDIVEQLLECGIKRYCSFELFYRYNNLFEIAKG